MTTPHSARDEDTDRLLRTIGRAIEAQDDLLHLQDEQFLLWLAHDLGEARTRAQRDKDDADAARFAEQHAHLYRIARANRAVPVWPLSERRAPMPLPVSQAVPIANAEGCAPRMELAAAAGAGRELWDDTADTWLELPPELHSGSHVALGVSGDSMLPVLEPDDVILVKLGAPPHVDDLIVARVPEMGFVVKRVAAMDGRHLELASFNQSYPPLRVRRTRTTVVGIVVARFRRTG